jgi:hypothetical protein
MKALMFIIAILLIALYVVSLYAIINESRMNIDGKFITIIITNGILMLCGLVLYEELPKKELV